MQTTSYFRILTAIFLGLLLSGCQNKPVKPAEPVPVEPVASPGPVTPPKPAQVIDSSDPRAKLVTGSEELLGKIKTKNPRFRTLGQLTQAQVMVVNLSEDRCTLEYKIDWEDDQGFNVNSINSWHRFTLSPRETKTITSTGKVPEARNIVFTVRRPDDIFIENEKHGYKQEMNDTTPVNTKGDTK